MTLKEAIKVIEGRFEIMGYCESARLEEARDLVIESLKQSQPQWILVSERLPVGSEIVLLTIPEHTDSYGEHYYDGVVCGHYVGGKNEEWGISDGSTFGYGLLSKVYEAEPIAWSPMPKPYQPESEG